jgi:hypothetical protein
MTSGAKDSQSVGAFTPGFKSEAESKSTASSILSLLAGELGAVRDAGFTLGKADRALDLLHDASGTLTEESTRLAVESELVKQARGERLGITDEQRTLGRKALDAAHGASDNVHNFAAHLHGGNGGDARNPQTPQQQVQQRRKHSSLLSDVLASVPTPASHTTAGLAKKVTARGGR